MFTSSNVCPGTKLALVSHQRDVGVRASVLHLTWIEAESCKSSCCRRGRMDEDWVTSSKTNMYLGQRFDAAERCRHEFASSLFDELSHQTYDHIVAVFDASYFRCADVVAITDVEDGNPHSSSTCFNS